jgi:hypothetical protein
LGVAEDKSAVIEKLNIKAFLLALAGATSSARPFCTFIATPAGGFITLIRNGISNLFMKVQL